MPVDDGARRRFAVFARRLTTGAISNRQFEKALPRSADPALHAIYVDGLWPLYDDLFEHKLIGRWALTDHARATVLRSILFLHSDLPYRYPTRTGLTQIPALLLSAFTLGWFGRVQRPYCRRGGDDSVWPFYSREEYETVLRNPVYMNRTNKATVRPFSNRDSMHR